MLVPLKWLKEFIDHDYTPEELAHALTMGGLEVDGIITRHQGLDKVVAAKVLAVEPHPQADKLRLAEVDYGQGTAKIVCGAPNLRQGMLSPLALPGAVLGEGFKVKKAKIRGVQSLGMLCSAKELGLGDDHSGIMDLDQALAPGAKIVDALNLETQVLDIGVTPNRGDALSILGVARDVAALCGKPLTLPEISIQENDPPIAEQTTITVSDPKGCPRYTARMVRGVKIGPSPHWMCDRLSAAGVRPISNVVDVTNYVLLERGQPLHAFDFETLAGRRIDVRLAQPGEKFTTLDGQERTLDEAMLLICDGERPVGLAGVMGGLNSEIGDSTRNVLIESAFFDPLGIRRTSKRLGLSTEASYRFERTIDIEGCMIANDRAAQLMADLAGGQVSRGSLDLYPRPFEPIELTLSVERTSRFLGLELTREQVIAPLVSLGLGLSDGPDADTLLVEPPSFRPDLERPVDLTEEVARLVGFDNFPAQMPQAAMNPQPRAKNQRVREKAKDLLAAIGFDEAVTYSFTHPDSVDRIGLAPDDPRRAVVKLMNPLSEELSALRTSLLPGLLEAVKRNLDQRQEDVALFEVGKVFWDRPGQKQPSEPSRISGLISGLAQPASWFTGEAPVSLAHARGAVEYLTQGLETPPMEIAAAENAPPYLEADTYCRAMVDGQLLGELGRLSARVSQSYDIERPVYLFDLDFDRLVELAQGKRAYAPLPRYPEVVRDVAMVVEEAVGAGEVLGAAAELVSGKAKKWLRKVELFDLYRGKPLSKGQKSLGLRLRYRDDKRTLTEKEVLPLHEALVQSLMEKFAGTLRT